MCWPCEHCTHVTLCCFAHSQYIFDSVCIWHLRVWLRFNCIRFIFWRPYHRVCQGMLRLFHSDKWISIDSYASLLGVFLEWIFWYIVNFTHQIIAIDQGASNKQNVKPKFNKFWFSMHFKDDTDIGRFCVVCVQVCHFQPIYMHGITTSPSLLWRAWHFYTFANTNTFFESFNRKVFVMLFCCFVSFFWAYKRVARGKYRI